MARSGAPRPACDDQAIALLGLRTHTAAELERKLLRRRYPAPEVAATLARLRTRGLLDDHEAARQLRESLERRGYGRRRIAAELQRRGAPEPDPTGPTSASDDEELARALLNARRFLARPDTRDSGKRSAALARHLERRGFAPRVIVTVLRQTGLPEPPALDLPAEEI